MPSIELVCIGQKEPIAFSNFAFAVVAETELISHRSRPLFQRELSRLQGCIYHVGNPDCRAPDYSGFYFAYEVLSVESREHLRNRFFEIAPEFQDSFRRFVHALLEASPAHSVFLYSDWQAGPSRASRYGTISESTFWQQHDAHQLKLNACYTLELDT
jgi:hypothetical protein